jgi:hypothetical protein
LVAVYRGTGIPPDATSALKQPILPNGRMVPVAAVSPLPVIFFYFKGRRILCEPIARQHELPDLPVKYAIPASRQA